MSDKPLQSALDQLLASHTAASPTPEAEARWRRNLRTAPRPDRCLGLSARAWAMACAACLLVACALAGTAWSATAAPAPHLVFSPVPAPVFFTSAAPRPRPQPVPAQVPTIAIPVPKSARVAAPTQQEVLLTRLVQEKPVALAQMLKGIQPAPLGEQQ